MFDYNPSWNKFRPYANLTLLSLKCLQMDPDHDRQISEHVLRMHRYRKPGEQEGEGKHCNHFIV